MSKRERKGGGRERARARARALRCTERGLLLQIAWGESRVHSAMVLNENSAARAELQCNWVMQASQ